MSRRCASWSSAAGATASVGASRSPERTSGPIGKSSSGRPRRLSPPSSARDRGSSPRSDSTSAPPRARSRPGKCRPLKLWLLTPPRPDLIPPDRGRIGNRAPAIGRIALARRLPGFHRSIPSRVGASGKPGTRFTPRIFQLCLTSRVAIPRRSRPKRSAPVMMRFCFPHTRIKSWSMTSSSACSGFIFMSPITSPSRVPMSVMTIGRCQ